MYQIIFLPRIDALLFARVTNSVPHQDEAFSDQKQSKLNSNGSSNTKEGNIRTMIQVKRGRSQRGAVVLIKFILYFIAVTVVTMPFLVSFLSTISDYETSELEHFLESSKVSLSSPPFGSKRAAIDRKDLWYEHSLENPPEDSPYTILHTITTRFMVGQASNATVGVAKQLEIQNARYMLFETFCWPTVQRQTSMNFYWIVLVDPNLEPTIIDKVKALLGDERHFPAQNAFMVLTNNTKWASDGVGVENSTSYGVGLQPVAQEFHDGTLEVVTGNTDYLLRALDTMKGTYEATHLASSSPKPLMVIETLLDADDGMNNGAVEWIQSKALQRTKEHWDKLQHKQHANTTATLEQSSPSLNTTWWFLCGTDHIEWHNREIFWLTQEEYAESGISSGLAGLRQSPLFCTSAGFTRIGITEIPKKPSGYSHMAFPKDGYSNHALTFYFPECTSSSNTSMGSNGNYSACWHREFEDKVYILKSRTITSDSMDHMHVGKQDYRDISWLNASDYPLLINDTEHMWEILGSEFSINRTKAWETSAYIFEHRHSIIRQNKLSRCSPGFPCFKTAKRNLIRMERYWAKQRIKKRKAEEAEAARKASAARASANSGSHSDGDASKAFIETMKKGLNGANQLNATEILLLRQHIAKNLESERAEHKDVFKPNSDSKTKA